MKGENRFGWLRSSGIFGFHNRFSEPFLINLLSLGVAAFGGISGENRF